MNHAEARSAPAAARPAPRESCDAPEGRADATARRDDAFSKRFRAAMGTSPRTWFNERRARAAAEALLDPEDTVAAVASRFGFGSEFYFSRFFRRHHGLSPSQWRRQCHV